MRGKTGHLSTQECWGPTGKCGGSAGVGRSSFCNHHSKDWIRQEWSTDTKSKRKLWWLAGYLHGLKVSSHRLLISCKGLKKQKVTTEGKNWARTWPCDQN